MTKSAQFALGQAGSVPGVTSRCCQLGEFGFSALFGAIPVAEDAGNHRNGQDSAIRDTWLHRSGPVRGIEP